MRRALIPTSALLLLWVSVTCQHGKGQDGPAVGKMVHVAGSEEVAPGTKKVQPPLPPEQAPSPSPRLERPESVKEMVSRIESHFSGRVGRRIYIQVDKPLYKPGETIWIKTWDLRARDLSGDHTNQGIHYQLVSPKGAVVLRKQVQEERGLAANDFEIPEGVQGGEYLVRAISFDGQRAERPIIVSTYEPPRIKKKLEFLRKAYGPGDEVTATIVVRRATGEPLKNHPLTGAIRLDDRDLPRVSLTTNDKGGGLVRFSLPKTIELGDGLLTVLVEDGGVTESVSKRIPIVLKRVQFSMFPEGGDLVLGLPGRIYLEAKNMLGKPADVEGLVRDDHGVTVARFRSHHHGMGRFDLTPATGRTYHAEITRPAGVKERFGLPVARESGCVLRGYDDLDGQQEALRLAVRCSEPRKVVLVAMMRENLLDAATVQVQDGQAAVVYLKPEKEALLRAQGIARVTVFDEQRNPLAERLIYRNRRARLGVKVKAHKKGYTPREQVTLTVTTTDAAGKPVPAELALSVVDDTVVSFADDKTGHMLSQLYLEPELPDKVEEPNVYFDLTEKKSALALDLLMGTRGWRRFEWQQILAQPEPTSVASGMPQGAADNRKFAEAPPPQPVLHALAGRRPPPAKRAPRARPRPVAPARPKMAKMRLEAPPPAIAPRPPMEPPVEAVMAEQEARPRRDLGRRRARGAKLDDLMDGAVGGPPGDDKGKMAKDEDWERGDAAEKQVAAGKPAPVWAAVRVFPAPTYRPDYSGPRTDFRETIHWAPQVLTGKDGSTTLTFFLSDAVTSFRVFSEGVAAGLAGRSETVIKSSLPFSMNVKLPLEVSEGDRLELPLTLTNETDRALDVSVQASFGELLALRRGEKRLTVPLPAGQRASLFYMVEVTGKQGKSEVAFAASAGSLKDEFKRQVVVAPLGFPQEVSKSGEVREKVAHEIDLGQAIKGTITASMRLYPSPVATMVSGLEGMLRQPSGCFEQASSNNYPNVMIMRYLREQDVNDPALLQRSNGLLQDGYRKLAGYESPKKGYEWFGGDPGHEALSAYGLLEFVDMAEVYGGVSREMIRRTAAWLRSRRDGKGGYLRNARALDSFGGASPEVTNAYITYALSEARQSGLEAEVRLQAELAKRTRDPYLLALAANTLLNVPAQRASGVAAAQLLAGLQGANGSWAGADHSITRSGGQNLVVETTALAAMALIKAGGHGERVRRAVAWLNGNRGGYGQWGATQATVLGLRAMIDHARAARRMLYPGEVAVRIGGREVARTRYEAGRREPLVIKDLGQYLASGKNEIEVLHQSKAELPYSLALSFRSRQPASSAKSVVELETDLERRRIKMGENVRATVRIKNRTDRGQPMTLARVGLPGGLTFQTWQLKELREKKLIAFYETKAREVILYFRQLKPGEEKVIPLDLVATVPGEYTGPASNAYLYYTDEDKTWTAPMKITVVP